MKKGAKWSKVTDKKYKEFKKLCTLITCLSYIKQIIPIIPKRNDIGNVNQKFTIVQIENV